ncbi:MAG TPA: tetratricopeptide repeat protein [Thermoanaerobaculia bacterium]|nr:tetratricopeptide repeat protein [Thermoanaerobaculia bacterium]
MSAEQDARGRNIAQAKEGSFAGVQVVNVYQDVRPQPVDAATLAAAEGLLASLPLDDVPSPAPLPPGSHLPHARNPLFVGREPDLRRLAAVLRGGGTAAIGQIAAATGLGGIGKTQLAVEFAHRYGRYFAGGVFWLSCADPAVVPAEVAACGAVGGLDLRPDFGSLKQDDQIALVLAAWQSALPRLLVFDNCEDPDLLGRWRPPTGGARVLVTSRRSSWDPALGVEPLSLDILPRAESVALLRKFRPELAAGDPGLDAICKELGDLPLALHLAGSYLYELRFSAEGSPAALLADLQSPALLEHPALQGLTEGSSPTGHERHVARTFALSFGQLDAEDPHDALVIRALARAARFAPGEPIPRDLLKKTFATAGQVEEELAAERALRRLNDLGLLETDAAGALRLHRLLARFVDALGADPEAADAVEATLFEEANRINREGFPAPLRPWLGHLRHVAAKAESRGGERAGSLWNELGYYLKSAGAYVEAREAYEAALRVDEAAFGPDHPDVATDVNNLGDVLQDLGDLPGALAAYERALRIDEAVFGPEHPKVANRVNNLGTVLQDLGDLPGARAAFERALQIDEAAFGSDHPMVAIDVNNLGSLLRNLGDFPGARAAFERALRIGETAFGPDHPNVAIRVNNLGNVLRDLGDLPGARAAFERALQIDEAALGPDHPDVAICVNNLAGVFRALGDLPSARAAFEQAVQIFEAALGPDHPKTRLARENLAILGPGT